MITGNHIWDKQETVEYINKEKALRPANLRKDRQEMVMEFILQKQKI